MSVRSEKAAVAPTNALAALDVSDSAAVGSPDQLGEGNNFCVANPENPLKRNLVVSIKATLNDFCLQKTRGTWAPTQEALRSIFQQKKFTSLDGAARGHGRPQGMHQPKPYSVPPHTTRLATHIHAHCHLVRSLSSCTT